LRFNLYDPEQFLGKLMIFALIENDLSLKLEKKSKNAHILVFGEFFEIINNLIN
jgi:hypothetical protein